MRSRGRAIWTGRARPLAGGRKKVWASEVRQILRCGDRAAEGGEAAHGLRLVGQLVDMPLGNARGRQAAHAGDDQHGNGIREGLGNGRRGIQQARSRDEEADPRPARGPGIAVGHEARALLMARLDMTDASFAPARGRAQGYACPECRTRCRRSYCSSSRTSAWPQLSVSTMIPPPSCRLPAD